MNSNNLSNNFKKIRKEEKISQEELAEKLGVSRQSVSKWESGTAYPEMDKVLQMCKLYNLNIDDLLNKDLEDVKEEKESKIKINKYIDDFLDFITKTINMLFSMKFIPLMKCLIEQFVIASILLFIGLILGGIGGSLFSSLFRLLPDEIYYSLRGIVESISICIYIAFSLVVMIHIFKTRYLDYYVVVDKEEIIKDNKEESNVEIINDSNKTNKKELKRKEQKIIIRDPKHASYGFINAILKLILVFIKAIVFFIAACFCFSLLGLIVLLAMSLYHISIHSIFIYSSITIFAASIINILFVIFFFDFLFNKKFPFKRSLILLIISIIIGGVGIGLGTLSFMNIDIIEDKNEENNVIETKTFKMDNQYTIFVEHPLEDIEFIVDNTKKDTFDIEVSYNNKVYELGIEDSNYEIDIFTRDRMDNFKTLYNTIINDLEENKINTYSYATTKITITTSRDNIKKLIYNSSLNESTILKTTKDKYVLSRMYTLLNGVCETKDGYYNKCVEVDGEIDNIKDFKLEKDVLTYDTNKYYCTPEGSSNYYECYLK